MSNLNDFFSDLEEKIQDPKLIEDFLNEEVKEYSIHVIKERAIPNIIDGFKPVQRKIVFTTNKVAKTSMKTSDLMGYVSAVGGYDKGPMSLPGAITNMVQTFAGGNNVPFLHGEGSFGSRFVPDGAAAERYTRTRIHKNFEKYFKDSELHEYSLQDERIFEPNFFLPIIPTILLNPTFGIASGFACSFLPYKESDVIDNIKRILTGKPQEDMTPHFEGFRGTVWRDTSTPDKRRWFITGTWEIVNSSKIIITEIPVDVSLEKYKGHLNDLIDKGEIKDYFDMSSAGEYKFEIICTRERVSQYSDMDPDRFDKIFKLTRSYTENLNCISINDRLLEFDNPNQIIEYFVKFRLKLMTKRRMFHLDRLIEEMKILACKIQFIKDVMKGLVDFHFKSRKEMIDMLKNGTHQATHYEYPEVLVEMNIYHITEEHQKKLEKEVKVKEKETTYYKKSTPEKLFDTDLENL